MFMSGTQKNQGPWEGTSGHRTETEEHLLVAQKQVNWAGDRERTATGVGEL